MSSSHLSRKDLKNDPLAKEVEQGVEYVAHHKNQAKVALAVGVVLLLAAGGYLFYRNQQAAARQEAYANARKIVMATVGSADQTGTLSFPTQDEKDKALVAAYTKVADDYPGTTEGSLAQMHVASLKMDKGDLDAAISAYRQVMDKGPAELASTAKLTVAQLLWGQGKVDEGKKLIQDLIDHPTEFVSADQAKLTLARLQMDSNPAEAKKLLETLTSAGSPSVKMLATDLANQIPN